MVDPGGIVNWSVTHVDWSEGKWHPKAYRAHDVTFDLLKNIAVCCPRMLISFLVFTYVQSSDFSFNLVTFHSFNFTVFMLSAVY